VSEGPIFLSTLPAQRRDRRLAGAVVGVSAVISSPQYPSPRCR
jgi:hypothetical protein